MEEVISLSKKYDDFQVEFLFYKNVISFLEKYSLKPKSLLNEEDDFFRSEIEANVARFEMEGKHFPEKIKIIFTGFSNNMKKKPHKEELDYIDSDDLLFKSSLLHPSRFSLFYVCLKG